MKPEPTLPPSFYRDPEAWARLQEELGRCWGWVGDLDALDPDGGVAPVELFGEPLLLLRDGAEARLLSNVCTHRWNLLQAAPGRVQQLRCGYHGRAFARDGRCLRAPGFAAPPDAPLPAARLARFGRLAFGSLSGEDFPLATLEAWLGHLPWAEARPVPAMSRVFEVRAHWALYVDNYLEGLHIPFVHPALSAQVGAYRTELVPGGVMQVAEAPAGAPALEAPEGHPDAGRRIAAWYLWLFPTTMLNVYPWGLSLNLVEPVAMDRTRVRFEAWAWDEALLGRGAGGALDPVEAEDEAVVEGVQRGVGARLARRGQLCAEERGTASFHAELARRVRPAERLERVEEKLGWIEHQLAELDEVAREAADGLGRVRRELGEVGSSLRELEHAAGGHEKPPHY